MVDYSCIQDSQSIADILRIVFSCSVPGIDPWNQSAESLLAINPCNRSLKSVLAINPCTRSLKSVLEIGPCNQSLQSFLAINPWNRSLQSILAIDPCYRSLEVVICRSLNDGRMRCFSYSASASSRSEIRRMILLKSLFNYHQVGRLIHFNCKSILI